MLKHHHAGRRHQDELGDVAAAELGVDDAAAGGHEDQHEGAEQLREQAAPLVAVVVELEHRLQLTRRVGRLGDGGHRAAVLRRELGVCGRRGALPVTPASRPCSLLFCVLVLQAARDRRDSPGLLAHPQASEQSGQGLRTGVVNHVVDGSVLRAFPATNAGCAPRSTVKNSGNDLLGGPQHVARRFGTSHRGPRPPRRGGRSALCATRIDSAPSEAAIAS